MIPIWLEIANKAREINDPRLLVLAYQVQGIEDLVNELLQRERAAMAAAGENVIRFRLRERA